MRHDGSLYTLEVFIIDGPMTDKFRKKNRVVSRTIQIRGDQTLRDLHRAIFEAVDREEEHLYEFEVGGKGPRDPKAKRYTLRSAAEDPFGMEEPAGDVSHTTIGSLDLKPKQAFGYWFDFGDDWRHQINVVAIEGQSPKDKYPKVTKRVGESPPRYVDRDDEE